MKSHFVQWFVSSVFVALFAAGCARGAQDLPIEGMLPSRSAFPLVLDALEPRCATMDCHGTPARNLRLYTGSGLRRAPMDIPGIGSTTLEEYEASFQSVVGLEPEWISIVVAEGGANPERLTLLRKGRGDEAHKGGHILVSGDPADTCVTSWLASSIDEEACHRAAEVIPPW